MQQKANTDGTRARHGLEWLVALLLVFCVTLVGFWEFMANRSQSLLDPFKLTGERTAGFAPEAGDWQILREHVRPDPLEPNILVLKLIPHDPAPQATSSAGLSRHTPVFVRLVHGYNMRDCMRIKGYDVDLVRDTRDPAYVGDTRPGSSRRGRSGGKYQVWRLTSNEGSVSIWITSMLSAGNFSETDVDVRAMAFPRVGIPDDPGWRPTGVTLRSLRHPIRNLRLFLRSKWNSARCDLATFLRLKRPAWASDELLTLVAASVGVSVDPALESEMIDHVMSAQRHILGELQTWRRREIEGREPETVRGPSGRSRAGRRS